MLDKREGYRRAFHGFDVGRVAAMTDEELTALLQDTGIIRNRRKILAIRINARAVEAIGDERDLAHYLWQFVDGGPVRNAWRSIAEVPAVTEASKRMSRNLKKDGFAFVGPTTCYAFMQSCGMVNDHLIDCFRYEQV